MIRSFSRSLHLRVRWRTRGFVGVAAAKRSQDPSEAHTEPNSQSAREKQTKHARHEKEKVFLWILLYLIELGDYGVEWGRKGSCGSPSTAKQIVCTQIHK